MIAEPFEFYVWSDGRYSVKVYGYTLDKLDPKSRVYIQRKFKSRKAAEKAAREKLAVIRAIAAA